MRCPELLDHLDAELHETLRQYSIGPDLLDVGKPARSLARTPDTPTLAAGLADVHEREAVRSQKLHDHAMDTHQRAVESGQRMRQAPRNQKRMPRTKKESNR